MIFSSFKEIPARYRAACLLNQSSIAKVSKINDGVAATFEQGLNPFLRAVIVCRNKGNPFRPVDDGVRLQVWHEHVVKRLDDSCSGGKRRNKLAGGQVSNFSR